MLRRAAGFVGRALVDAAATDAERLPLWLPVGFGAGALGYFRLAFEPSPLWPAGLALAAVAGAWAGRRSVIAPPAVIAVLLFAAGWGWAQAVTAWSATPTLDRETRAIALAGTIVDIDPQEGASTRLVLDDIAIAGWDARDLPARVRLTIRAADGTPAPGARLDARAVLRPPPPPVAPGGYDFQRRAYFDGIGAVGFALGTASIAAADPAGWRPDLIIEDARRAIGADIAAALDGAEAALAAALVVGERGQIADADRDALRDAGLAHLLAISGLHIGIVAGFVFWGLRLLLALVPALAVRWPIKKWAATVAMACAFVYMLIAGATPPTQRAFIMVAVALLAILIDRNPISMRLVAVAAFGVLLLAPETVLGPSFQLSFAAVVALIAAFEWLEARRVLVDRGSGAMRSRPLLYLAGVAYSTLIATVATAPFALFHFQQAALYGVAANLAAIPLMAFWIMPWLAIGSLASLVDLGALGFVPAGWGIAALRWVAETTASWPGAVFRSPQGPDWTIAAVALGGLWLCLWRSRLRWLGLAPAAVGLAAMLAARPPALLVSGTGQPYGVVAEAGTLHVPNLRRDRFTIESWARLVGTDAPRALADIADGAPDARVACDAFGCVLRRDGVTVALSRRADALDADCRLADLVVHLFPGGPPCPTAALVIPYWRLARDGAHSIAIGADGVVTIMTVGEVRGERPWVRTNR